MPQYVDLFRRLDKLDKRDGIVELPPDTLALRALLNDQPGDADDGSFAIARLRDLGPDNSLAVFLLDGLDPPSGDLTCPPPRVSG
jgi:hypothetical protein